MPGILSRYAFREIILPTLLAGVALTFIILVAAKAPWENDERLLLTLMKLFLREETPKAEVVKIFLLGLPTILMFIAPMALLVGIIVGVGRMTLDLEVRSMQTGGINLMRVFFPIILFGGILSGIATWLSYGAEPQMVEASIRRGGRLLISEFTNLEPGRVYEKLFSGRSGLHLYFAERDPVEEQMKGVSLMLERRALEDKEKRKEEKEATKAQLKRLKRLEADGEISREKAERLAYELQLGKRDELPILIFAERANFEIDPVEAQVHLSLNEGSLHLLEPPQEPDKKRLVEDAQEAEAQVKRVKRLEAEGEISAEDAARIEQELEAGEPEEELDQGDYAIIQFGKLSKVETVGQPDSRKGRRMKTVPELLEMVDDGDLDDEDRLEAKATVLERFSLALESLIFALIGLPLAIWIRPSGKSIGILLAAGVIFSYHLLMRTGYTMILSESALGELVIFSPNILFGALGIFLWRRAIRS